MLSGPDKTVIQLMILAKSGDGIVRLGIMKAIAVGGNLFDVGGGGQSGNAVQVGGRDGVRRLNDKVHCLIHTGVEFAILYILSLTWHKPRLFSRFTSMNPKISDFDLK